MNQPILVFGAALKKNGHPRPVLIARVKAAITYAERYHLSAVYIVTGGKPQEGISEAQVMRQLLLQEGISDQHIICEDQASNTIQSVRLCTALLKKWAFDSKQQAIVIVSSAYHYPRCRWLMFLAGWHTITAPAPLRDASRSFWRCWYWRLREIPAIIWDSFRFLGQFN